MTYPKARPIILATVGAIAAVMVASVFTPILPAFAHLCPSDTTNACIPGRMTGGGVARTTNLADNTPIQITHGFEIHCPNADGTIPSPNNLEVNWNNGNSFHLTSVIGVGCEYDPSVGSPNPPNAPFNSMSISGLGKLNGVDDGFIYAVFTDGGEPGKGVDTVNYNIVDTSTGQLIVVVPTTPLSGGNQQAHSVSGSK